MKIRLPPVMLLIMIICMVASGCVTPQESVPAPVPVSPGETLQSPASTPGITMQDVSIATHQETTRTPTPDVSPVITYCPGFGNESPFITLDPLSDLYRGDEAIIHGETNLPAGKTIEILITEPSYHTQLKCAFDDELRAVAKVRKGPGCNNSFAFPLESTSLQPQEYFVTARYRQDTSVSSARIFAILKNTTSRASAGSSSGGILVNSSLAMDPVWDIRKGEMITITGHTGKTGRALQYSIRDAMYGPDCQRSCTGEQFGGIMYPDADGDDARTFSLRFNSTDIDPGRYTFRMDQLCTDESVEKSFNIVE